MFLCSLTRLMNRSDSVLLSGKSFCSSHHMSKQTLTIMQCCIVCMNGVYRCVLYSVVCNAYLRCVRELGFSVLIRDRALECVV